MSKINSKDISVIVQGGIDKDNTPKCLKSIRKYLPEAEIILSTWENENTKGLLYDKLIQSKDIECGFADLAKTKINNLNRMLVSTQVGLNEANRKYILKIRSDLILKNTKFLKFYTKFHKIETTDYCVLKNKILIPSIFTRKFLGEGKRRLYTPFHVSDWLHFGTIDDIKKLWQVDLVKEPDFSEYFTDKPIRKNYACGGRTWKFSPEQYLGYSLIRKKYPEIKMKDLLDFNDEILNISDKFIETNFIVVRPYDITIKNDKYKINEIHNEDEFMLHGFHRAKTLNFDKIKRNLLNIIKFKNQLIIKILGIKIKHTKKG